MFYLHLRTNPIIQFLTLGVFYTAIAWISFVFFTHGIKGIQIAESFLQITGLLGFAPTTTKILVLLVGILDLFAVVLLVINPRWWVLVWTGLWPWIPYFIVKYAGGSLNIYEFAFTSLAAMVALLILPDKTFFTRFLKYLRESSGTSALSKN